MAFGDGYGHIGHFQSVNLAAEIMKIAVGVDHWKRHRQKTGQEQQQPWRRLAVH
jgi:hypothetical protein